MAEPIIHDLEQAISEGVDLALKHARAQDVDDRSAATMLLMVAARVAADSLGPTRIQEIVRKVLAESPKGIPSLPHWCRGVIQGGDSIIIPGKPPRSIAAALQRPHYDPTQHRLDALRGRDDQEPPCG